MTQMLQCGSDQCDYAIDISGMKPLRLKALKRWKKTCPRCHQMTIWQEQTSLLQTNTIKQLNGGAQHEKHRKKNRRKTIDRENWSH